MIFFSPFLTEYTLYIQKRKEIIVIKPKLNEGSKTYNKKKLEKNTKINKYPKFLLILKGCFLEDELEVQVQEEELVVVE